MATKYVTLKDSNGDTLYPQAVATNLAPGSVTGDKIDIPSLTSSYEITGMPAHSGGTNNYQLTKVLNIVVLNVTHIWANSASTSWVTLGTIPSGIRPSAIKSSSGIVAEGANGDIVAYGKVQIETNGNIRFRANIAYNYLVSHGFSITWVVE